MTSRLSITRGIAGAGGSPGYLPGRFYSAVPGTMAALAVPTVDTIITLYPFSAVDYPLVATSLNVRTTTGAVGSAVKMAVWANSPTTKRPVGVPVIGSNTGQATTGSGSTASIAVSKTFYPGETYWFGSAYTTLAPTALGLVTTNLWGTMLMGRSAVSNAVTICLSAPYAYATDIMALDLTSATYTDVTTMTPPILFIGT